MNFFKILNLLTLIAVSNVNASENNTNMSNTLHLSNSSLANLTEINNEPFSCFLSSIDNDRNSSCQDNSGVFANISDTLYLSNSSIDVAIDIEQADPFYCETSVIEENKNSDIMSDSEAEEYENILNGFKKNSSL